MLSASVGELWRYPVKSMRGENCERLSLDQRGVIGDRLYAVRDEAGKFGSGKTTQRFRRIDGLLRFRAVYDGEVPLITFADGTTLRGDDPAIHAALSAQLGMAVTLSREAEISHFDAGPIHLLTTASMRTLGGSLSAEALDGGGFARTSSSRPKQVASPKTPGMAGTSPWVPKYACASSEEPSAVSWWASPRTNCPMMRAFCGKSPG